MQENIVFENVKVTSEKMVAFLRSNTPIKNITVKDSDLAHTRMAISRVDVPDVHYGKGDITIQNVKYTPREDKPMIFVGGGLDVDVTIKE